MGEPTLLGSALAKLHDRGEAHPATPPPEGAQGAARAAFRAILATVPTGPGVLEDTPGRAARAWQEATQGYAVDTDELLRTFDAEGHDELVIVRSIPFYSMCEHHLAPFFGHAHIGYIPNGRIVGLSKLARLVDAYARRLQVQERITDQIADTIERCLKARGVIVVLEAQHLCMLQRGVKAAGSHTLTSVVRGILKEDPRARHEALELMGLSR